MKIIFWKTIAIVALTINLATAEAAFLSFSGEENDLNTSLELGQSVTLSFGIFDIADNDDLGGYDIDLSIAGTSAMLDSAISVAPTSFDVNSVTSTTNGLEVFGLSFLFDLSAQASEFALGEFVFTATSLGLTTIAVSGAELSDAFGFLLSSDNYFATINVVDATVPQVSAPPVLGLFLILLTSLVFRRHARQ